MMKNFLDQARKMQSEVLKVQEELKNTVFEGAAGGGAVLVKVSGDMVVKEVKINPEILKPEEAEMVADLVTAALNAALGQVKAETSRKMGFIAGGLNLPGLI
jgi:DNA-binding YbaB/EbfC family protein